jgi:hypothetical protein
VRHMRGFVRRLLLIVTALALVSGSVVAVAAPPAGAEQSCAHGDDQGSPQHHRDRADGTGCLVCCLAACVGVPSMPSQPLLSVAPIAAVRISYWFGHRALAGRNIPPDPAPPRTRA